MNFQMFLARWRGGTLPLDASWRAYDIPAAVKVRHVLYALKEMRLRYAGELAIPEVMARYGIGTREEAAAILGAWWVWSRINAGHRIQGLAKRAGVGSGARVVAPDPS